MRISREHTLYRANNKEADFVETRRIRDFISSGVVIHMYLVSFMWSLYTEMGDRDASLEGEELHNNSPIFTNLQKIEIDVYGTALDLDFRCANMGTITLFFL